MKVLLVTDVFHSSQGGGAIILREVFSRLAEKGYDITVLTPSKKEPIEGIDIKTVPIKSRELFVFSALKKSVELAKKSDIINTATYFGGFPANIAKFFSKKPCLLSCLTYFGKKWGKLRSFPLSLAGYGIEYMLFKLKFDKIACLSSSQFKALEQVGIERKGIEVVYPGVDFSVFKPKKASKETIDAEGKFVYAFFGRADKQKGVDILLEAAEEFSQKEPDSKLLMILSDGPEKKNIIKMIDSLKLKDNLIFLEAQTQKNLVKLLNASDAVVVPSRGESFGLAAAEASALRKPVIASNVDSLPEIIMDKKTGFLVKPEEPKEIVDRLCVLANNSRLGKKMGSKGKKYVRKFSWENAAKKYDKIYQEIANIKK